MAKTGVNLNESDESKLDQMKAQLKALNEERDKLIKGGSSTNGIDKQIGDVNNQIDKLNNNIKKTKAEQDEAFNKLKTNIVAILADGGKYNDMFDKMDASTQKLLTNSEFLKTIFKPNGDIEEETQKYKKFIETISNSDTYKKAQAGLSKLGDDQKATVNKIMGGFNISDFAQTDKNGKNNMDEYYNIMAKVEDMAKAGVPTLEEFQNKLLTAFPDLTGKFSAEEWKKLFDNIKDGAADSAHSVDDLGKAVDKLQSELETNLGKAENYGKMLSEIQSTGHLSASSEKMIITKKDYQDLIPYLTNMSDLATQLQSKLSDIKDESQNAFAVASVAEQQKSLQSLLDTYNSLNSSDSLSTADQARLNKAVQGLSKNVEGLNVVTDSNGKMTITNIGIVNQRIATLDTEKKYIGLVAIEGKEKAEQEMQNEKNKTKTLIEETEKRLEAQNAYYKVEKAKVDEAYKNAKTPEEKAEAKKMADSANNVFNAIVQGQSDLDKLKEKEDTQVDTQKAINDGNKEISKSGTELNSVITNLTDNTNEQTKAQKAQTEAIKAAKNAVQEYQNQIESLDNLIKNQKNYEDTLANGSQEKTDAILKRIEMYKQQINNTRNAENKANQLAGSLASQSGQSIGNSMGQQIVNEAAKYLGTPYKWGKDTPQEGFDCSGLVEYVFKQFQISLDRTTYEQVKQGSPVDKGNLQPGDLVFFGSADNVHHVGIYAGNGEYIQAPKTGDVVKISNLDDRSDYYGARRIVPSNIGGGGTPATTTVINNNINTSGSPTITADKLNKVLGGALAGHGQDYLNASQKYGVDPALAVVIATLETGHGSVVTHNNPGGVMDWDNNWSTLRDFPSLSEGIDYAVKNLKTGYLDQGLTTIAQIGQKYSPVGAANDPNGTNKDWIPSVTSIYNQITGGSVTDTSNLVSEAQNMQKSALEMQSKGIDYIKSIRDAYISIYNNKKQGFENDIKKVDVQVQELNEQNSLEKANDNNVINNLKQIRDVGKNKLETQKAEKAFLEKQLTNPSGVYDKAMLQTIKTDLDTVTENILEQYKTMKDNVVNWMKSEEARIEAKYKDTTDLISNKLAEIDNQATPDISEKLILQAEQIDLYQKKIIEYKEKVKELNDYQYQTSDNSLNEELKNTVNDLTAAESKLSELKKGFNDTKNAMNDSVSSIMDKIKQVLQKNNENIKEEINKGLKLFTDAVDKAEAKLDETKKKMDNNTTNYDDIQNVIKLQNKLNAYLGNDVISNAKKADIQKELDEANRKLKEDTTNQNIEAQKDALSKAKLEYQKAVQNYTDNIDKSNTDENLNIQSSQALINGFIVDGNGNKVDLKAALLDFEDKFGQGLTVIGNKIKTELIDKLNQALEVANKFKTFDTTKIDASQAIKTVYGTGIDLENAKSILGANGYNYIDTNMVSPDKL